MLELATLGFLQRQPLHGYTLKQQLELFMSTCISVNYGSIYPMLKRLEERGDIVTVSEDEGRKVYAITSQGCDRWKTKMMDHPRESWVNSRSRFGIKVFFFDFLVPSERIKLIEHRLMTCKLRLEQWENHDFNDHGYQGEAWQRSLEMIRSEIDWLIKLLTAEQSQL